MFEPSNDWKAEFPGAHAGVLVMRGVANPPHHAALEEHKQELEEGLRRSFAGQDRPALLKQPVLQAYAAYYRRFDKTYHIQLQLESIVFKGKSIPSVAALVECMFMAEMKNLLLTAGHDLDALKLPVRLDVARGTESYTLMRGEAQTLKAGDMYIADAEGVMSCILYGPDRRTRITLETSSAVFTVYAPAGIDEASVARHLEDLRDNILLIAPTARVDLLQVFAAGA